MENSKPTALTPGKYVPPAPWNEISSDEKIGRMRDIIKDLQRALSRAQVDIHTLRNNFKQHSHSENNILVPYNEYNGNNLAGISEASSVSGANFF